MVAVALALLIPISILSSADAPVGPPTPADSPGPDTNPEQLPQGSPPKVLYAENLNKVELGLLHDGERQASLNSGQAIIPVARIQSAWLVVVTVATDGTKPPAGGWSSWTSPRVAASPSRSCARVASPDGRYLALPDGEAIPVDGGAARRTTPMDGPGSAVWEDGTRLLVQTGSGDDDWLRTIVVRCDVPAGRCERAYDRTVNRRSGASPWLTLAQP